MSAHTMDGLAGETASPTLPMSSLDSPGLLVSSIHFSPPSVDLKIPLPAPPLTSCHGFRPACQNPAYSVDGSAGSITSSIAPVESFRKRILFHVAPPSAVR